jgi:hypothetical protein
MQLAGERVASIREFDPSKWERPAKDEPIIESIEVTTKVTAPLSGEDNQDEKRPVESKRQPPQ